MLLTLLVMGGAMLITFVLLNSATLYQVRPALARAAQIL